MGVRRDQGRVRWCAIPTCLWSPACPARAPASGPDLQEQSHPGRQAAGWAPDRGVVSRSCVCQQGQLQTPKLPKKSPARKPAEVLRVMPWCGAKGSHHGQGRVWKQPCSLRATRGLCLAAWADVCVRVGTSCQRGHSAGNSLQPSVFQTHCPLGDTHPHTEADAGVSWLPFLPLQSVHPGATLRQSTG